MRHIKFNGTDRSLLNQTQLIYKIADSTYQSNLNIEELNHLIDSTTDASKACQSLKYSNNLVTYSDTCMIGEQAFNLHVTSNNKNCYLIKHESDSYCIAKNSIHINCKKVDLNLLFGPVLILNLSLNDVFCLHASAFELNDKIFVLMADSGTGKSTIAKYLDENTQGTRVADDILPMSLVDNKITVLPNFPQLKLPREHQYQGEPIQKQVVLIFAQTTKKQSKLSKINHFESLKRIIKHSVATKLFTTTGLKKHLEFCYQVCQNAQSYDLQYAHSEDSLMNLMRDLNGIP